MHNSYIYIFFLIVLLLKSSFILTTIRSFFFFFQVIENYIKNWLILMEISYVD